MKQIQIVIADSNEEFAIQVQNKIESMIGANAEITIITDQSYLFSYFDKLRQMNVLLIDEKMYFRGLERHNIEDIFLLTEDPDMENSETGGFLEYVYRFSGLRNIADKVLSRLPENLFSEKVPQKKSKLILVTAPSGGCGKTTTALALAMALNRRGRKVLYADLTSMQQSSFWLLDRKKDKDDGFLQDHLLPGEVKKIIEHAGFDYIHPFAQPLATIGVSNQEYRSVIEGIMQETIYEYVILDTDSEFSTDLAYWISVADTVLILSMQDLYSMKKLQMFQNSIDCSNDEKFRLICAMYRPERKNHVCTLPNVGESMLYIPYANMGDRVDLKILAEMKCYKNLAATFS